MSRIGKLPVAIPDNVQASVEDVTVRVEGPKGKLERTFNKSVRITIEENAILVAPVGQDRFARCMYGTTRSIIASMVRGVSEGYAKKLEINGVGFRADLQGKNLNLALGYSHPINYSVPDGINVVVEGQTKLTVSGVDKQLVGQVAADIKSYYPVEPYKGKGVRIEGEFVRRKEGKKAG